MANDQHSLKLQLFHCRFTVTYSPDFALIGNCVWGYVQRNLAIITKRSVKLTRAFGRKPKIQRAKLIRFFPRIRACSLINFAILLSLLSFLLNPSSTLLWNNTNEVKVKFRNKIVKPLWSWTYFLDNWHNVWTIGVIVVFCIRRTGSFNRYEAKSKANGIILSELRGAKQERTLLF